ncbi:MAG: hypothetical protein PHT48_01545 [Dechloromonas sp.]|nr:hypothetical protein [Dechloromonas sp.]
MRCLAVLLLLLVGGCSTQLDKTGRATTTVDAKYLLKTEVDRMADAGRQQLVDGLLLVADKLYRRNPRELKKTGLVDRQMAISRLRQHHKHGWPELLGARERHAASLAFAENYSGDRVAALMFGLLTMVDAAFEYKSEFYMLDGLNEAKLFNTARNLEIAMWKLAHDRDGQGQLFLLSNELTVEQRNLSFEREFGRLTGLLDFLAKVVADRNGRTLSRFGQAVATAFFLPVGL